MFSSARPGSASAISAPSADLFSSARPGSASALAFPCAEGAVSAESGQASSSGSSLTSLPCSESYCARDAARAEEIDALTAAAPRAIRERAPLMRRASSERTSLSSMAPSSC